MSTSVGLSNYSEIEIENIVFLDIQRLRENFHFENIDFLYTKLTTFWKQNFWKSKKKI